ncbi:MAG: gamma-glutamylcyclotransferase [Ramlibacter sp.]|nr:gamma-glutamylcyclotransferase [Ramlibacter sp.]
MPDDTAAQARHVFVYGTLRRGDDNDITRLLPAPRWVGNAMIPGTMYHFGRYPGVTLGGASEVVGEVYEISEELERVLDEIEEVYPQQTNEYAKRFVDVDLHGKPLRCIVYEIHPGRVAGRPCIASGDWVRDR